MASADALVEDVLEDDPDEDCAPARTVTKEVGRSWVVWLSALAVTRTTEVSTPPPGVMVTTGMVVLLLVVEEVVEVDDDVVDEVCSTSETGCRPTKVTVSVTAGWFAAPPTTKFGAILMGAWCCIGAARSHAAALELCPIGRIPLGS